MRALSAEPGDSPAARSSAPGRNGGSTPGPLSRGRSHLCSSGWLRWEGPLVIYADVYRKHTGLLTYRTERQRVIQALAGLCRSARAGVADCNHYRKGPGSPAGRRPRVHGNRPHVEPESRPPALRMEPKPTARKGPLRALCPHASSSQTLSESFLVGRLRLGPLISLSNQSVRGCCGP